MQTESLRSDQHTHTHTHCATIGYTSVCEREICSLFRERPTAESLELPRLPLSLSLYGWREEQREKKLRSDTQGPYRVFTALYTLSTRDLEEHLTKYTQRYQTHKTRVARGF